MNHAPPTLARLLCTLGLLLALPIAALAQPAPTVVQNDTGILVVTPDRGFLGNQEIHDAFEAFAKGRNAALLYVTDKRSATILDERLAALEQHGATRIVVLPLVMSTADARWQLVDQWLQARKQKGLQLAIAQPYGASYLAVEDLSARLRAVPTDKQHLLLVGYGAANSASAATMRTQLKRMGGFASTLAPDAIDAAVYPTRKGADAEALRKSFEHAVANAHGALVVPVAFAPRDDSMMTFHNWFADTLPKDAQLVTSPLANTEALAQWMQRAAIEAGTAFAPIAPSQVGVVALAHGADWFWNHAIEQALAPVAARYKLAFAFSMADPPVVERAVRELEKENVRAIVVVRIFSMPSSFRHSVMRMIGADVEAGMPAQAGHAMAMHGHGGMHGMHGKMKTLGAPPRIRSGIPIVTVGGVGDSAYFAKALLANARAVSKDPSRETVILVGHGLGDDAGNQHWLDVLGSLARQMRADGGDTFRAIEVATWREDWPDKRKAAVQHVRRLVEQADNEGGRAIVVPARTNEHGNADRYLKGLDFGWSKAGFAQTPYFAQWFEEDIGRGISKLRPAKATVPQP